MKKFSKIYRKTFFTRKDLRREKLNLNDLQKFFLEKRKEFPILEKKVNGKNLIYFDNGASTQKPKCVIKKISEVYENFYANVHRGIHELSIKSSFEFEKVRERVAKFINSESGEIIFTSGTTESINLIAFGLLHLLKKDDEILLSEIEHHANLVPWQEVCKVTGAKLKFLKLNENFEIDIENQKSLFSNKTKIVSVAHISNVLGTENSLEKISELAKKVGAIFIVDVAQSIGHKKIDVEKIKCDALAFSAHKMYGPSGVGILLAKKNLIQKIHPQKFGGDMIDEVSFFSSTYKKNFAKLEAGTPNIADVIAFGEGIDFLEKISIEKIFKYENFLSEYFLKKAQNFPELKIFGPKLSKRSPVQLENTNFRSPIFSFWVENFHPHDLGEILNSEGIAVRTGHHCAMPLHTEILKIPASTRVSLSFYNTTDEIDKFFEVIKNLRDKNFVKEKFKKSLVR